MQKSDMNEVMDYLATAEGTEVHYLNNEKDFTTPYGIYSYRHPETKIVKRIRAIALSNGVISQSKDWTKEDIEKINNIVQTQYADEIRDLATEFYLEFTNSVHLEFFPKLARVAMYSMYANSPKRAWMAVQQSLLDMRDSDSFKFSGALSVVDGSYGSKTGDSLKEFTDYLQVKNDNDKFGHLYFETLLLSNMKTQYIRLALANPEKYLQYLKGWDNRMSALQRLR